MLVERLKDTGRNKHPGLGTVGSREGAAKNDQCGCLWLGRGSRGPNALLSSVYSELVGHVNHPWRLGLAHVSGSRGE